MIGHRRKRSNVWNLMILIGRGLDYSLGEAKRPRKETEAEEARKPGVVAETKEINEKQRTKVRRRIFGVRTVQLSGCARRVSARRRRKAESAEKPQKGASSKPFPVAMTKGSHLFPYRTQKLRPSAPMVLGWTRPGRVGRRRIPLEAILNGLLLFCVHSIIQRGPPAFLSARSIPKFRPGCPGPLFPGNPA